MKKYSTTNHLYILIFIPVFILTLLIFPSYLYPESLNGDFDGVSDERSSLYTSEALYSDYIDLAARNAIIMDSTSTNIIWEKNSRETVYPASITKIMTGI